MNVIRFPLVAVLSLSVVLSGCEVFTGDHGIFRGRSKDYLKTGSIKPIEVPTGTQTASLEPLYAIPEINALDEFGDPVELEEYEVPRPRPIGNDNDVLGVKIQKLSGARWIFLDAPTSQVWPRAQSFLSEYNIKVLKSDASAGVIETDWIHFKDDTELKSKYRLYLQKGIHPETTEVHILHTQAAKDVVATDDFSWPTKSDSAEREAWLLDELAAVLADSINNSSASLLGQNVGGELKASFARVGSEPSLHLSLPFGRAWATVAHSLGEEGYVEWSNDSDNRVFHVGFKPEESEGGFLSWMAFWGDEDVAETSKYEIKQVLAHLQDSSEVRSTFAHMADAKFADPLDGASGFLIVFLGEENKLNVVVRDHRGNKIPARNAKEMLRILRKNLI